MWSSKLWRFFFLIVVLQDQHFYVLGQKIGGRILLMRVLGNFSEPTTPLPLPEEIQISTPPPVESVNNNSSSDKENGKKHSHLFRPTAIAGILFAILFFCMCAGLFCFVYASASKKKKSRATHGPNNSATKSSSLQESGDFEQL